MLYANGNNTNEYAGLFKALADLGVDEKTLGIAREYLDLSKPMNNALLEPIKPQDMTVRADYRWSEKLAQFGEQEIRRAQNDELLDRYTLLCHAIAGNTCAPMLYFANGTKQHALHERALKRRYGSHADAVMLACEMQRFTHAGWGRMPQCTNVQILSEAMDRCIANLPGAKLLLCAYILTLEPLPQRKLLFKSKPGAEAQKAIAFVEECWKSIAAFRSNRKSILYLMLASAAGTFFSEYIAKQYHHNIQHHKMDVAEQAIHIPTENAAVRILLSIAGNPCGDDPEFICKVACWTKAKTASLGDGGVLADLAKRYPENYKTALIRATTIPDTALLMEDVLRKAAPEHVSTEYSVGQLAKARCIDAICTDYPNQKDAIVDYLCEETGLEPLLPLAPQMVLPKYHYSGTQVNYIAAFGLDDFAKRCICVQALAVHGLSHYANCTPGFRVRGNEAQFAEILREGGMPFPLIFKAACEIVENASDYNGAQTEMRDKFFHEFMQNPDEIAACDRKPLNVMGRSLYLQILGTRPEDYKTQILSLADDGSKVIRAELAEFLKQHPEWMQDLLTLLKAKKAAKRELAAEVLGAFGDLEAYREELQAALEAETKPDVKQKLAALLGEECPAEAAAETTADLITDLTKGSKTKKLQWLFDTPFTPVRTADGGEAETAHLQALLLCYANMTSYGVSDMANGLAARLHQDDLAAFALEVLGRWLESGAAAKQKWVLYFTALHGGFEAQTTLLHYIKEWSEHARGAIAADAVRAIAFKGTSEALMAVDNMARKFKNRQVRAAAAEALGQAADALHITTEELADRIVPNLGFDESLCRIFDYGTRQFKVYLTPALELEIFEGEKKLKNLPKPGAKDDSETAEASAKAFKEMKKQLKNTITAQKQRLEYALLCPRTWTAQGWQDLFVKNPVMHCFAIGLIWGTYDADGKLQDTFRYMEDGTFNTADEDEYALPEDAVIGLLHPVEPDADTLAAWKQQLEDYEITQPFPQLDRAVFTLAENENGQTEVCRFAGRTLNNLTLLGRMTKYGWSKGMAQDGGFFYEFERQDIIRREKGADGAVRSVGFHAELRFSGMYIAAYDNEDVTIEKVRFFHMGSTEPLQLEQVNRRYFSEIMMQLSAALAAAAASESEQNKA